MVSHKKWKQTINKSIELLEPLKDKKGKYPFDCLVGVSRSGGIVGAVLAYQLELPFMYFGHVADDISKKEGVTPDRRPGLFPDPNSLQDCRSALYVDDCSSNGRSFRSCQRAMLASAARPEWKTDGTRYVIYDENSMRIPLTKEDRVLIQ